jgi:hypothetical protein
VEAEIDLGQYLDRAKSFRDAAQFDDWRSDGGLGACPLTLPSPPTRGRGFFLLPLPACGERAGVRGVLQRQLGRRRQ